MTRSVNQYRFLWKNNIHPPIRPANQDENLGINFMCPNPAQLITFFHVINVPGLYIQGSKVSKVQSEQILNQALLMCKFPGCLSQKAQI